MARITRRRFVKSSASMVASSTFLISGTKASGNIIGANDRIRIAVAGLNGRGKAHIDGWLGNKNVEIAYLVDPDKEPLGRQMKSVAKRTEGQASPQGVSDIRHALDDKNVDAISVATPNHWHSLMTIWGAQAGKHVYVEKPMSHDCDEGRIVVEAQKKHGVVIQHGTQSRSNAQIAGLHEAVEAGEFGQLKISYGYCCKPREGIGHKPVSEVPANLDWDLWRGPANIEDYHANLVHYNWHWFWETGNGDMNNQGTHQLDIARWALDSQQTHPVRVMALGGRFKWNDQGETPNTMFGIAEYPNGQYVCFNVRNVNYDGYQRQVENEYYFEDGGKIIRGEYFAKGDTKGKKLSLKPGKVTPGGNWKAFLAAVRANDPTMANGNALDAHYGCVLGHLMNNSYRLGKPARFSAKVGEFIGHPEATEHFVKLHDVMAKGVGVTQDEHYVVGPWLAFDPQSERHTGQHADAANALLKDTNRPGFKIPRANEI